VLLKTGRPALPRATYRRSNNVTKRRKTDKQVAIDNIKGMQKELKRLEAAIGKTEDQLGLRRSKRSLAWDERLRRIEDRRAKLAAK
jgi:hypothetical protein